MNEAEGSPSAHVLVVADSEATLTVLPEQLRQSGVLVAVAHQPAEVLSDSADRWWDAVIIDLTPTAASIDLVQRLHERHPMLATIVLSADQQSTSIRAAVAAGAYSWLSTPCPIELVEAAVARAHERRQLQRQVALAQRDPSLPWTVLHSVNNQLAGIIGLTQLHVNDDTLEPELRADLEMVLQGAQLINQLLKPLRRE